MLYNTPIISASPDIKLPEPKISKSLVFFLRFLSRVYIHFIFGFAKVLTSGDSLYESFSRALSDKCRLIIAFRHANGAEPQLLGWFFLYRLKSYAAKKGIRFDLRPHTLFIFGCEVVRWGGWIARFVMPNLGAMPIHHSKIDTKGMRRIYKAITEGPYPVSVAPEGQVSYFTDRIPHLENGTVTIGFQAALELEKKNDNRPVQILPLSIHLRYNSKGEAAMERLLKRIEKFCGFSLKETSVLSFTERLDKCREYILSINEKRYHLRNEEALSFNERLLKVTYAALLTAERSLGIKTGEIINDDKEFFQRLYRVRHVCWDRIFLPEIKNLRCLPPVYHNMLDLGAGEAWYISRHQELADFCYYFTAELPLEETPLHNKIEYVMNLWDFANRTMGGAISGRLNIKPEKIIIKSAPVINISERLNDYKANKKAAVKDCVSVLEKAFIGCINEVNNTDWR